MSGIISSPCHQQFIWLEWFIKVVKILAIFLHNILQTTITQMIVHHSINLIAISKSFKTTELSQRIVSRKLWKSYKASSVYPVDMTENNEQSLVIFTWIVLKLQWFIVTLKILYHSIKFIPNFKILQNNWLLIKG